MEFAEISELVQAVGQGQPALIKATRGLKLTGVALQWLADTTTVNLRASTRAAYYISLRYLENTGIATVAEAIPSNVRAWMRRLVERGRSPETANRHLAALTSLFSWLHAEGRAPLAQILELRELYLGRPDRPVPEFLRPAAYVAFRMAVREAVDESFELLCSLGVEAGLRYHEAVQVHGEDLHLDDEPYLKVSLTHGRKNKKNRERTVPLRRSFANELASRKLSHGPLFPSRQRRNETNVSPYMHRGTFKTRRLSTFEAVGYA